MTGLARRMLQLWHRQPADWPQLADGLAALRQATRRSWPVCNALVSAQCNPVRLASASAGIDPASLAKRPCQLCLDRLPKQQKAIEYRQDWLILCNPAPLFDPHFTIASKSHQPQRISPALDTMLALTRDLDGAYTVFYNGPKCGASLPDHLHLQAAPIGALPCERELASRICGNDGNSARRWIDWVRDDPVRVGLTPHCYRPGVILVGENSDAICQGVALVMTLLNKINPVEPESMMNLLITYTEDRWIVWIFPRQAHRPSCYGSGPNHFLISPGSVDVAGLLIVPRPTDFDRLTPKVIGDIYEQVLFSNQQYAHLRSLLVEHE
ncbi:MAG: DUF4922 domain-containing protein [Phycisphaerales bacterium]|nr:DUF4922 domain-containing protein [Phycisphaerales bacterium]